MLSTIIDHSTISAVERLSGRIPVNNLYVIDGDIVALEAFVQAHLFYDQIVALDDYKDEYSADRKGKYPSFLWLNCQEFPYDDMVIAAREQVQNYQIGVRKSGKLEGEFGGLIKLLLHNIAFTWRMTSSTFYLQVSMLGATEDSRIHRYTKTWESLKSALDDLERIRGDSAAIDEIADDLVAKFEQPPVSDPCIDGTAKNFLAALAWLSQRTILYSNIASANNLDLTLHPIRNSFRTNYLGQLGLDRELIPNLVRSIGNEHFDILEKIESSRHSSFSIIEVPFFSAYLASKKVRPSEFSSVLLEIREEPPLVEWRKRLRELKYVAKTEGPEQEAKKITDAMIALQKEKTRLLQNYGVQTKQDISSTNIIALANSGLAISGYPALIPRVDWKLPNFRIADRLTGRMRPSMILTSWISSVTRVERLGHLRSHLSKEVDRVGKFHSAPVEDEKYVGRNSSVRYWAQTKRK